MEINSKVIHQAYGIGTVIDIQSCKDGTQIVQVEWEWPELSQWPGENAIDVFWTQYEDLKVLSPKTLSPSE